MIDRDAYVKAFKEVGQYYVAVRKDGIFVVDGPDVCRRRHDDVKEAMLCLFMSAGEANAYRETFGEEVSVRKVTLTGLWAMLKTIGTNTMNKFKVPLCVYICGVNEGGSTKPILLLHSTEATHS